MTTVLITYSSIELNTAILCAALLFAKPLLRRIFPCLLGPTAGPTLESRIRRSDPGFSRIGAESGRDRQGLKGKMVATMRTSNDPSALVSDSQEIIELS